MFCDHVYHVQTVFWNHRILVCLPSPFKFNLTGSVVSHHEPPVSASIFRPCNLIWSKKMYFSISVSCVWSCLPHSYQLTLARWSTPQTFKRQTQHTVERLSSPRVNEAFPLHLSPLCYLQYSFHFVDFSFVRPAVRAPRPDLYQATQTHTVQKIHEAMW